MKMQTKLKSYNLTLTLIDKIAELQNRMGLKHEVSVIEYCINYTHKKELGK